MKLLASAVLTTIAILAQATSPDANGVTAQTDFALLHRPGLEFPTEAARHNISGDVVVSVTTNASGEVADAHIVSGPAELRRSVLQQVLGWHFNPQGLSPSFEITFRFDSTKATLQSLGSLPKLTGDNESQTVRKIDVSALPAALQQTVIAQSGIQEGETITPSGLIDLVRRARDIDSHLNVGVSARDGDVTLTYTLQGAAASSPPTRIRIGGGTQAANLLTKVAPVYPPLAKAARVQGTVRFTVIIGKDGTVLNLQLVSGHPLLIPAATEAVKQWVYYPTLLNGNPVEVITQVDVNFTLVDPPPAPQN